MNKPVYSNIYKNQQTQQTITERDKKDPRHLCTSDLMVGRSPLVGNQPGPKIYFHTFYKIIKEEKAILINQISHLNQLKEISLPLYKRNHSN